MLPATRGMRKEMLPLFYLGRQGRPVLAPVAHLVVRSLHAGGASEFAMVIGRDGDAVKKYFTPDTQIEARHQHHRERLIETLVLNRFLREVRFRWVHQPAAKGFGDAVLRARSVVGGEPFLMHAADALLWERRPGRLIAAMEDLRQVEGAAAVLLVRRVPRPQSYGVVQATRAGRWDGETYLRVKGMEEKPANPKSHWAATAVYAFGPEMMPALAAEARSHPRELEVTSGIRRLIREGHKVLAVTLRPESGAWLSVGSPEGYLRALRRTYVRSQGPPT